MKRFKLVFASLAVATAVISAFAFTPAKNLAVQTYYFGGNNQLITANVSGQILDPRENSLTEIRIINLANWSTTSNATFSTGSHIAAISFDLESVSDGGADGQLSLQEAIEGLWDYFDTNSQTLPSNGGTISVDSVTVTIYRKAAVS